MVGDDLSALSASVLHSVSVKPHTESQKLTPMAINRKDL
jgi:hypothetical protein